MSKLPHTVGQGPQRCTQYLSGWGINPCRRGGKSRFAGLTSLIAQFPPEGQSGNRSAFVEQVLRDFLAAKALRFDAAKGLEILNQFADELNEEAADTLSYQVKW